MLKIGKNKLTASPQKAMFVLLLINNVKKHFSIVQRLMKNYGFKAKAFSKHSL